MPTDLDDSTNQWIPAAGRVLGVVLLLVVLALPNDGSLPLPAQRLAASTALMATFWLTQAAPMAVTALLPLVLFPLMGVQSAEVVSKAYIDTNVFLFLGGFIVAMGIEKWGLHRRMALHVVRLLGTSSSRIVLGFMLATAFLSMWISNTAATLLMLPIALALATSLRELPEDDADQARRRDMAINRLMIALLLGTAYAASIGGFTSLVGTPTNLVFVQTWKESFPTAPEIAAGPWMVALVPIGAVFLTIAWRVLVWRLPPVPMSAATGRRFFADQLRRLGPPSRAERLMLAVFVTTALLWLFRTNLQFADVTLVPGWGPWLEDILDLHALTGVAPGKPVIHDSTVAMAMAVLMFLLPARTDGRGCTEPLMDWKSAEKLPWGILLLIGGGFALAGAFESTGLAKWLGAEFASSVTGWPTWLIVAGVCFLLTFLTELTSNVATAATLLPVLAGTAVTIGIDPLLVMAPASISASCAFMLPIATPPNAIVFGSGRITMRQMASYGLVLNLIGVMLITAATFLIIAPQLGATSQ